MKVIVEIKSNKVGKRFAMVLLPDATYGVYVECENYSRHVKGGIAKTWRYCEKGLSYDDAKKLLDKKSNGRQS